MSKRPLNQVKEERSNIVHDRFNHCAVTQMMASYDKIHCLPFTVILSNLTDVNTVPAVSARVFVCDVTWPLHRQVTRLPQRGEPWTDPRTRRPPSTFMSDCTFFQHQDLTVTLGQLHISFWAVCSLDPAVNNESINWHLILQTDPKEFLVTQTIQYTNHYHIPLDTTHMKKTAQFKNQIISHFRNMLQTPRFTIGSWRWVDGDIKWTGF